ncbi:FAD-binding oxidoreductase [Streptomyces hoynatensis]|uniref:FAD-binding oxidoreductase n=1 Tax=Streptomyces hoynatensis TaxID=1141874 RepID=A0A3A9YRX2_9ACTN|nr:FAD-binding protein [Streptomyces hoynatensis]RKN38214.1 FAD-binding oxidoreductase [Streptomyces hoynatensis]
MNDAVNALRTKVRGAVLLPGEEGYDRERAAFNTALDHRPALIVGAAEAADVREAVAFAGCCGLPVAVRGTGHGASVPADGGLLITTARLKGVRVDARKATAHVAAGSRWEEVTAAAAAAGLAPLSGSAPFVGVTGYLLGGGLPLLGRTFGWAADRIRAIEVVTADGVLRRVSAHEEPELFWALRGGRDNFGVVTALEIELLRLREVWGGGLYFDAERPGEAARLLTAYLRWTRTVPEEMNSSLALVPFPAAPAVPEPLRGRYAAHLRIACVSDARTAERLVAPLRALGEPLLGGLGPVPVTETGRIHAEPSRPMPWHGDNAMLDDLDEEDARLLAETAGPAAPARCVVEIRHLGGALARRPRDAAPAGHRAARYLLGGLVRLGAPDAEAAGKVGQSLFEALAPRTLGRFANFLGHGPQAAPEQVATAYEPGDLRRLAELKAVWDPANLFRLNHNIPPTG